MKHLRIIALTAQMLFVGGTCSAGSYDGDWTGSAVSAAGNRCKPGQITITVQSRVVTGEAALDLDVPRINGTVWDDGAFGATLGWQHFTGKFNGDEFQGTINSADCRWKVILQRGRKSP